MIYTCDCGREFKTVRAMSVHQYKGCPAAILDDFMNGLSVGRLMDRYGKNYNHSIEEALRSEISRRLSSAASARASAGGSSPEASSLQTS